VIVALDLEVVLLGRKVASESYSPAAEQELCNRRVRATRDHCAWSSYRRRKN
jgi:hypothetical protein